MTDRLTKGDRVIVVDAADPAHNETGTIDIDDGSINLPYFVKFDSEMRGEWYREMDVAPAAYRPIAPGEHVPEGADVFIPAGLASRHGATGGMRGAVKTFSEIDEDGDLPVMVPTPPDGKQMMWFCATDCYINATAAQTKETGVRVPVSDEARAEFAPGGLIDAPRADDATATGQPIRVLRRHTIVLEQPVSPDDLARAARALEPGMRLNVQSYVDRIEIVGTDPEDGRG